MGCGGSRADAIEPRYYESWTRETESTWLTYTDSDTPPSAAAPDSGPEAGGLPAGERVRSPQMPAPSQSLADHKLFASFRCHPLLPSTGALEDGLPSNAMPRSAAPEKNMNSGIQCPNSQSLSSGPLTHKQNGLWTTEAKRDVKRMSAKEVTINVTDSIRQMDRSKRIAKNCIN
ncbi:brain and acute leukemia cytoplasmic protein [Perognathus longimembris pacificus]|uniref:brain and acute leukemia cytoplasmic protein n=1 Tax=Perognathus longimembris pacificus TaxID=214514 RepID=UPI00201883E2|nr:brain and acute leukemia cytoplasmic protein [Perognathus longimembris pacificus]